MNRKQPQTNNRLVLISWLILPLIGVWIATNYLVVVVRSGISGRKPEVLSSQTAFNAPNECNNAEENEFTWNGSGLITLWFDDGWYSQYSIAFPLLKEKGFKGALAIATSLIQGDSYMTWPQVKKLKAKGWETTSHSVNHICEKDRFNAETVGYELIESQNILQAHGLPAEHFVTPCGAGDPLITKIAKEHYLSLRTAGEGLNRLPVPNPYELKNHAVRNVTTLKDIRQWIKETETGNGWLIIVFHQIGEAGADYEITPGMFEDILEIIENSGLPVILPSQALNVSVGNSGI